MLQFKSNPFWALNPTLYGQTGRKPTVAACSGPVAHYQTGNDWRNRILRADKAQGSKETEREYFG
jgi:hypothetical protein